MDPAGRCAGKGSWSVLAGATQRILPVLITCVSLYVNGISNQEMHANVMFSGFLKDRAV